MGKELAKWQVQNPIRGVGQARRSCSNYVWFTQHFGLHLLSDYVWFTEHFRLHLLSNYYKWEDFLNVKNENLCINGCTWCFDTIWFYSVSHVYIRRPTFGTRSLHSESPLEHDFFFNMKWWNEVSSGMKHECNEIFNESWSESDAGEKRLSLILSSESNV